MLLNLYNSFVFGSASSGLESAKSTLLAQIKPIVNMVAVPLIDAVLLVVLVFAIGHCVTAYREGEGVRYGKPAFIIAGIVLVSTFPMWGWQILS